MPVTFRVHARVDKLRRRFLAQALAILAAPLPLLAARNAQAQVDTIVPVIRELTKGAEVRTGRVKLDLPRLADNGNSVALKVTVESPMTAADYVRGIHLFSEKNPRPVIARFHLGPQAGRAEVTTRIRLNGTQRVVAIAELADGTFWSDVAEVAVTLSACVDGT
jgi:sulfur-oxidizing protein SoxY